LRRPKIFYGYWVLAAAFLCIFISQGCGFFTFSLFVKPLEADMGWGRGEIMGAFTVFFLSMGIFSPVVGRIVDRYGVRRVIFAGALMMGIGFILLGLMQELWHFYLSYAIAGIGGAAIGIAPASVAVSNWFEKRRGLAIGIMSAGLGIGGMVIALLVGGYLIPTWSWRISYISMGLLIIVTIVPTALFVIRTKPSDMGLYPDGATSPEENGTPDAELVNTTGPNAKMAFASLSFWLIGMSFLLNAFCHVGVIQNQAPHLEDIGFPTAMVAGALGCVGMGSAFGKLAFGWLCDRIQAKYACAIGLTLQIVAIILIMNIKPTSPLSLIWIYSIVMGIGAGSWLPTLSMLTSTTFGLSSYGAILGAALLMEHIGTATGPLMAGYIYDVTGSYHWAFIIFLSLYAISMPAILVLRRRSQSKSGKDCSISR